jgi:hypothetical protein
MMPRLGIGRRFKNGGDDEERKEEGSSRLILTIKF